MEKQLDPVIEIQHLNKSFGSVHAVNDQWRGKDRRQRSRSEAGRH